MAIHVPFNRPMNIEKFKVHTSLNRNVVLLRIFPSMRTETIAHFLKPPIEGVVLQCYGAGNVPNNRGDIMELLKAATQRGVIIISVTQCINGSVSGIYATGKALLDIGVIPGNDLTPEAALTKLSYVLSKQEWDLKVRRRKMETNLMGEMTILHFKAGAAKDLTNIDQDDEEHDLILAVAKQLNVKTSDEMEGIRQVLFPSIMCAATQTGQKERLEYMRTKFEANFSAADYDARTPLHIAASEGNLDLVEYLMKAGANVHVRDRSNDTPLLCAIKACHRDVVRSLVSCGAHLKVESTELAEELCYLARTGQKKKISCYKLAGADLNMVNLSGQTALHAATEVGQFKVQKLKFIFRIF